MFFNNENKKVLFLINPPYKAAGNNKCDGSSNAGVGKTKINEIMLKGKVGRCAAQLYAQFMYKITELSKIYECDVVTCQFSPYKICTGESFIGIRHRIDLISSFMFDSLAFSDVSGGWPVSCMLWKNGSYKFSYKTYAIDFKDSDSERELKIIHNLETDKSAQSLADIQPSKTKIDRPSLTNALNPFRITKPTPIDSLAVMNYGGNVVFEQKYVYMLSVRPSQYHKHISITKYNILQSFALFSARMLTVKTWKNAYDQYLMPDISHLDYNQWNRDAIVYTLFNNACETSSLRQIECETNTYDIFNNLFWRSPEDIESLADTYGTSLLYQDVKTYGSKRFLSDLPKLNLSQDARDVLNKTNEILEKTFPFRNNPMQNDKGLDVHVQAWDAGWYQIKLIAKEYCPNDLKDFRVLYKKFEERMREGVYKFGF